MERRFALSSTVVSPLRAFRLVRILLVLSLLVVPTARAQEDQDTSAPADTSTSSETAAFSPVAGPDAYGYTALRASADAPAPFPWRTDVRDTGGVVLDLVAASSFRAGIPLTFSFPFYGYTYDTVWMTTTGVLGFGQPIGWSVSSYINERLPSARLGPAIAAFWDELSPTGDRRLAYRSYGTAPNRVFVAEWSSDHYCCTWRGDQPNYPAFQVELHEDGTIIVRYQDTTGDSVDRGRASIGIQNETSSIGLQYAYHEAVVQDGLEIEFQRPAGLATVPYVPPAPQAELTLADCQQSLVGGFRKLVQTDAAVHSKIGCPRSPETSYQFSQQEFEGGHMLYRPDTKQILVRFADDGRWASFPDPYQGEPEPDSTPPEGRVAPKLGFGKLWRTSPGLHDRLGWALADERYFQGTLQEFTGGTLLWTGVEQWIMRAYFRDGSTRVTLDPTQLT